MKIKLTVFIIYYLLELDHIKCIQLQPTEVIYYPTGEFDYSLLSPDDKILNYCYFIKYKLPANVMMVSDDINVCAKAAGFGFKTINDFNTPVSSFLNKEGLI
jgi:predicted ribonuclease YlaK